MDRSKSGSRSSQHTWGSTTTTTTKGETKTEAPSHTLFLPYWGIKDWGPFCCFWPPKNNNATPPPKNNSTVHWMIYGVWFGLISMLCTMMYIYGVSSSLFSGSMVFSLVSMVCTLMSLVFRVISMMSMVWCGAWRWLAGERGDVARTPGLPPQTLASRWPSELLGDSTFFPPMAPQ